MHVQPNNGKFSDRVLKSVSSFMYSYSLLYTLGAKEDPLLPFFDLVRFATFTSLSQATIIPEDLANNTLFHIFLVKSD